MKTFGLILAGMFCAAAQGAISDMLFATGDGTFAGAPGNFGAGKFCVLYAETGLPTVVRLLAPEVLPDLRLINPHRANGTLAFNFGGPASNIQISTNLVDWEPSWHGQLPQLGMRPHFFVRQIHTPWECIKNLRYIDAVKQNWAFTNFRNPTDTPTDFDLFSASFPKPSCPANGTYVIGEILIKPYCTIADHTL